MSFFYTVHPPPHFHQKFLITTTTRKNHKYLHPNEFINSWDPPEDPKEVEWRLAQLRRQYAKQVKEVRNEYIQEMELQRTDKQRKDEVKKEALRVANKERKAAKLAAKKVKAAVLQVAAEEFRLTLLKERAEEKLEYWRKRDEPYTGDIAEEEGNKLEAKTLKPWLMKLLNP